MNNILSNNESGLEFPDLPRNQIRSWIDNELSEIIPIPSVRQFVITNLNAGKNGDYSWKCNVPVLYRDINSLRNFPDTNEVYSEDTLFIGGKLSPYITEEMHSDIKKLFPMADIEMIDDCGHWVHADKPQIFVDLCSDFLLTLP